MTFLNYDKRIELKSAVALKSRNFDIQLQDRKSIMTVEIMRYEVIFMTKI